jgi:hypothetical protein
MEEVNLFKVHNHNDTLLYYLYVLIKKNLFIRYFTFSGGFLELHLQNPVFFILMANINLIYPHGRT